MLDPESPIAQLIGDQMLDPMVQDIAGGGGFLAGLGEYSKPVDSFAESVRELGKAMQETFLSATGQSVIDAAFQFGESLAMGNSAASSFGGAIGSFFDSIIKMLPQMLLMGAANAAMIPGGAGLPLAGLLLAAAAGTSVLGGYIAGSQNAPPATSSSTRSGTTVNVYGDINDTDRFVAKVNNVIDQRVAGL
jgi:hypothetical protein